MQDVVRTNLACDDTAFNCVTQTQDEEGLLGVRLNKDIVQVCVLCDTSGCIGVAAPASTVGTSSNFVSSPPDPCLA